MRFNLIQLALGMLPDASFIWSVAGIEHFVQSAGSFRMAVRAIRCMGIMQ